MSLGLFEFVVIATLLVILALALRAAWTGRARWNPTVWAHQMDLQLTPRNEAIVRSYIGRTRLLRCAGALIGFFAPAIYRAYAGSPPPVPVDFVLFDALLGYMMGAVIAELTIKRPKADEPSASLVPRELADYIPARFITALRASALLALALVPLYRLLPTRLNLVDLNDFPPEMVILPTILLIGFGVEFLQRYIVARPQPAVDNDLVNADDAIRSASVHALAGAGIALELLIVSAQLLNLAVVSDLQLLRWTLPALALISFAIAIGSWVHLTKPSHRGHWHTRRTIHA